MNKLLSIILMSIVIFTSCQQEKSEEERIEEEKELLKEFGLKNKKEVWRVSS